LQAVYYLAAGAASTADAASATGAAGAASTAETAAGASTTAGAAAGASAAFSPQADKARANRAATRADNFMLSFLKVKLKMIENFVRLR
jgi:hypothetical protein